MYVLDLSGKQPVFYQVDGWHQYEHPFYWTKTIEMEAENTEGLSGTALITENSKKADYDFSDFNTFVRVEPGNAINITIPQSREPESLASLFLKKSSGNPLLLLKTGSGTVKKSIVSTELKEIKLSGSEIKSLRLKPGEMLQLSVENGSLLLDKLIF